MLEKRLHDELLRVGRRVRRTHLLTARGAVWLVAAAVGFCGLIAVRSGSLTAPWLAHAILVAAVGISLAITWRAWRRKIDLVDTARRIEACYPELNAKLLAAVEQRRERGQKRLGYLQTSVVGEALAHGRRDGWVRAASGSRLMIARLMQYAALALLAVVVVKLSREEDHRSNAELAGGATLPAGVKYDATIEPGDTELERGTSLLVLARFKGELPSEVALVHEPAGGQLAPRVDSGTRSESATNRLAMSKSLDDPLFAGRVSSVEQDLTYHVEYGGERSPTYRVTVFEYPELQRADIKLAFPGYTGQAETLVEDTHQVTAVEGTKLTLLARLNKDVAEARLEGEDGKTLKLTADNQERHVYTTTFPLTATGRYKLHLVDDKGRRNKSPDEFTFTAVVNRRPEIKLVFPSKDVQVSPLEEIELAASVWDDFGLITYGVAFSLDGQPPKEVTLGGKSPNVGDSLRESNSNSRSELATKREKLEARRLVSFEELKAEPDQLLSYYFYADDAGPDGQPRRTSSDMFFCEVRHFEEIFRQGEQPPSGSSQQQQGAGQEAEKLAELQKQVISANWKLVRREGEAPAEPPGKLSAEFPKDSAAILEGQQEALNLADELEEKLRNPESKAHLDTARKHMRAAIDELQKAVAGPVAAPLTPALSSERAAYQALLKLRAREHQVTRNNSRSPSSGSQGQRSAEQLSELELKESDNRYEEQRAAADPQENAAQRETRQVLSRLKELAQRQQDLNERIKEMQSALDEAKTEQEKEEIRKQLKRLRDEEQQILRDADELRNRMDQPENQQRMAEAKQQLDQTRQNVRQASEALEKGQASQAAAAGSRAEKQFEDLREEFRKQAAGRFNEEVKQMRDDARQLEKNEQELAEKLTNLDAPKSKTLRESSGRDEAQQGLEKQKADLEKLLTEMRNTVEEAETSEPLLSKQLYDTIRQTHQQKPADALEMTKQLLERGFVDESRQAEQKAQAGITKLREGVEKAADSVLGDEAEAIRRARDQVAELGKEVQEEMRRLAPGERGQPQPGETASGENRGNGEPRGEQKEQPPKDGSTPAATPGERGQQAGERGKPGDDAKPGEPQKGETASGEKPGQGEGRGQPGQQPGEPGQQGQRGQSGEQGQPNRQGQPQPGEAQARGNKEQRGQGEQHGQGTSAQGREGQRNLIESVAGGGFTGPLTGGDFRPWSDRLRDVEEMLGDPQLRAEAARIRDRASAMRAEFKRHSKEPNWDLVRTTVYEPLVELQQRLAEELLKRQSKDALVPLDRDPVPPKYSEQVRRYYERLGSGQ